MPLDDLLMKVLTTFYRRLYLFSKPIDPIPADDPAVAAQVRLLTAADLEAYCAQSPRHTAAVFLERLEAGHQCYAVFNQGRLAHTGWAATGRPYVPYLKRLIALRPDEFFIYDTYTRPDLRNHGLVKLRNIAMQRYYRERGYTRSIGVVAVENQRAAQVARDAGYICLGLLGCWRLGPLQRDWQRPFTTEPLPALLPPA